jgi:protein-tyrosine phosphatase
MTPEVPRPLPERFVLLDGCFNFRDLGGYPTANGGVVRRRILYRSDALHRLSPTGQDAFSLLGVATVVDLRTGAEVAQRAWQPPVAWPGLWLHIPLLDSTPDWKSYDPERFVAEDFATAHYLETVQRGAAALQQVLAVLSEPGTLPAVFHCAAGKDRTGIVAGVLLALLGVPAETVADDYALSEVATERWKASIAAGAQDDTQTAWGYVPPAMLVAEGRTMLSFLARIEDLYGSVERLATSIGVTGATLRRLHDVLVD